MSDDCDNCQVTALPHLPVLSMSHREEEMRKVRQEGNPLVLTGNIGHFGVGAQNAVFYMGNCEHVMSRAVTAKGIAQVEDMVICAEEIHRNYEKDRKTAYDFVVNTRALGDAQLLREPEKHTGIKDMITNEKKEDLKHFSMFVVSGVYPDHSELLGKRTEGDGRWEKMRELKQDVARIYNYYLHGTDDELLQSFVPSDSEQDTSDEEDEDEDDSTDAPTRSSQGRAGAKRKSKQSATTLAKRNKVSNGSKGEALLKDIDIHFVFITPSGEELDIAGAKDLRDEHTNMEFQMRVKMKSSFSFNLELPGKNGPNHKVTVRLYYFPKILDEEKRPLDVYEQKENLDQPIISCYWEGRWIPYAQVNNIKKVFKKIADDPMNRHLLRRLRGSMFFPHSFIPTNNKLKFRDPPQVAVDDEAVRVYPDGKWDYDSERDVQAKFRSWILECQKNYDKDIKFAMDGSKEALFDEKENKTYYDKLTYGNMEYRLKQKVSITMNKPHLHGEITKIYREGNTVSSNDATYTGFIQIKRWPLEIYGVSDQVNQWPIEVTRLINQKPTDEVPSAVKK